ncbi:hypothetical protein ACIRBX_26705 [Kitasatospora sp. NPDC096147]|uniref:hypothetical protein n=1 Tax=Kitasatospora sp. NPDC096147 TaxID=3364093 RepID=UPI00380C9389
MGLSISVGMLQDQARNDPEGLEYHQRAFDRLHEALAAEGVAWQEPPLGGPQQSPAFSGGFPYRYLTLLRRVLALVNRSEPVTPAEEDGAVWERDCELIQDEVSMFASHLICHADNAGYYVPVDFADPLFLPAGTSVAGAGMVGSTQQLLRELTVIATALGIDPEQAGGGGTAETEHGGAFEAEWFAWGQLHHACRASLAEGQAIVFH